MHLQDQGLATESRSPTHDIIDPSPKPVNDQTSDDHAKPFSSSHHLFQALDSSPIELLNIACRQLKFHLRLMFQPTHDAYADALRVLVEYIDANPTLPQLWTIFNRAKTNPPLQVLIMDVIALFLSIPIPLPTHRGPLFRTLLETQTLGTFLSPGAFPLATLATLRVLLHATRAGMVHDIWNAALVGPYPHLAMSRKHQPKGRADLKPPKATSIRSTYMQFMSAVVRSADSTVRQRLLDDREFLGPLIRNMDQDSHEVVVEWLTCLTEVLDDFGIPRATKSIFFNGYLVDHVRKLYTCPQLRAPAHEFLMNACTRPGRGMCHRDAGLFGKLLSHSKGRAPQGTGGPANRVLAGLISKLELSDPLQVELVLAILAASPELAGPWSVSLTVSMDPRPSTTWMRNADLIARFINLNVPSLYDHAPSAAAQVFPLIPPPAENMLVHIAPTPLILRAHFMRGLAVSSPIVLFTTFRLILAVLDKLDQSLLHIRCAATWWSHRDTEASRTWNALADSVAALVAKQLPDIACVLKALTNAHALLIKGSYELPESVDETIRALETKEDVTPTMVYLCAVRVLKLVSRIFPDHIPPSMETADLLSPLPAKDLCVDLLELLIECPPTLSPRSLATLLRLHATGQFFTQSVPLLTKLLRSSPLFDACAHEIGWWLEQFPDNSDVVAWVTNLFGYSQSRMYAMTDLIVAALGSVVELSAGSDICLPFSPLAVALVQNLSSSNPTLIDMSEAAHQFGRIILLRILASQQDPRPLQCVLEKYQLSQLSQGVDPVCLDALNTHPVLCISRLLQRLKLGDSLQLILTEISNQLEIQPRQDDETKAAQFRMILSHQGIVSAISSNPELVSQFCIRTLTATKSHVDSPLRSIALDFAARFRSVLTDGSPVNNVHARCLGAVCLALSLPLDLDDIPTSRLSVRQWLSVIPALRKVPVTVAKMVLTLTDRISEAHIDIMLQVLASQFPVTFVRNSGIQTLTPQTTKSVPGLDLDSLPVDILDELVRTRVINPEPRRMVMTTLAAYSARFLNRLLSLCGEMDELDPECVTAVIHACVRLGPGPTFQLSVNPPGIEEALMALTRHVPHLIASTNLCVAMTLYKGMLEESIPGGIDLVPTLPSYVIYYLSACRSSTDNPHAVSGYFNQAIEILIDHSPKLSDLVMMELIQYMTQIVRPDIVVCGEKADRLVRLLLELESDWYPQTSKVVPKYTRAWAPVLATQLTPHQLVHLIETMLATTERCWDEQAAACTEHIHAIHAMMRAHPKKLCKQDYLYRMIDMYGGTVDCRDQAILCLLYTFETHADTNLGPVLMSCWGGRGKPAGNAIANFGLGMGDEQDLVRRSMEQIDLETMHRTALQFPLDVDLCVGESEPLDGMDGEKKVVQEWSTCDELVTDVLKTHLGTMYDVRFMIPMVFKYLESGNSIDIGMLVDRGLIALVVAALASNQSSMRRAALVVMDEFYGLIPTSRIKGKTTLVQILDMIRHFLGPRTTEGEVPQLPVATASIMTYAIQLIHQPSHPAYVPLLSAIMEKPQIDPESIPGILQVISKNSTAQHHHHPQVKENAWVYPLIESILRSGRGTVLMQHRHVLDWIHEQLMRGPNQRASLGVLVMMSLQASRSEQERPEIERVVLTSGSLAMLQMYADVCPDVGAQMEILRGIVCVFPIRSSLVLQALVQLAVTCLDQVLRVAARLDVRVWVPVLQALVARYAGRTGVGLDSLFFTLLSDRVVLVAKAVEPWIDNEIDRAELSRVLSRLHR